MYFYLLAEIKKMRLYHQPTMKDEILTFISWATIGAVSTVYATSIGPILLVALLSGIVNKLGGRLGEPLADYIESKIKLKGIKYFTNWLRKKQKPKL
jgi:hypothetical protein